MLSLIIVLRPDYIHWHSNPNAGKMAHRLKSSGTALLSEHLSMVETLQTR